MNWFSSTPPPQILRPLILEATEVTPSVHLDPKQGHFEIAGRSFPENVSTFYGPLMKWWENYATQPNTRTHLILKIDYFNTASAKSMLDLLLKLEDIRDAGREVLVSWHYHPDDEDMEEMGAEYEDVVDIPFECVHL